MANNFYNAVRRNVSNDSTLPTEVYKVPDTKKAILIELDVSNKSSAGITVTVQLEDESQNESGGNAHTVTVATGVTGLITTTSAAAHNLIVNDRVVFTNGTDPSFTDASLPPSGDATLSETRMYYVQSIPSASTFTIAESKSGTLLTFDNNGSGVVFTKIHPTTGSEVLFQNVAGSTNYQIKFASPGDTTIDYGSTQGFAAAMSVALG